jgi:hypothetical protein
MGIMIRQTFPYLCHNSRERQGISRTARGNAGQVERLGSPINGQPPGDRTG